MIVIDLMRGLIREGKGLGLFPGIFGKNVGVIFRPCLNLIPNPVRRKSNGVNADLVRLKISVSAVIFKLRGCVLVFVVPIKATYAVRRKWCELNDPNSLGLFVGHCDKADLVIDKTRQKDWIVLVPCLNSLELAHRQTPEMSLRQ